MLHGGVEYVLADHLHADFGQTRYSHTIKVVGHTVLQAMLGSHPLLPAGEVLVLWWRGIFPMLGNWARYSDPSWPDFWDLLLPTEQRRGLGILRRPFVNRRPGHLCCWFLHPLLAT